ncbi:MAG: hypothetical protein A3C48_00175 [Candidatus Nealsonbacteria bacterium RIFCSPHIGHO2_02_FULL_38_75]|nr:MAG: hypothetical protein A3C48_00175 [Candidatus Nealsonbacteria bacterium RIFCSPHIGHO2_02_FULL_38_75]
MKRRSQNQKFSFPFFAGSPHTPRRKRNCKEIFGFGLRPKGACEAQRVLVKILRILSEIHSNFV